MQRALARGFNYRTFSRPSSSRPATSVPTGTTTAATMSGGAIKRVQAISIPAPMPTQSPFLFNVYHKDEFPPCPDGSMKPPRKGNGADFAPGPWRMYHGREYSGFPQHPHRGFETITAVMRGTIDHTDSCGNAGRYGDGDLQHMTAGRGVVHGELFPLVHKDRNNTLQLFQIWLNLPSKDKMVQPAFVMHWSEDVRKTSTSDGGVDITVWTGEYEGVKSLAPTPRSYAADPSNDVGVYLLKFKPGAEFTLRAASGGVETNRSLYYVEGASLDVCGEKLSRKCVVDVDASQDIPLRNSGSDDVICLVLQGKPINEPVAQHGPFVMYVDSRALVARIVEPSSRCLLLNHSTD